MARLVKNEDNSSRKAMFQQYAFVDIEGDEDVFIPPTCLNGAVDGDQVIVEITSKKGICYYTTSL